MADSKTYPTDSAPLPPLRVATNAEASQMSLPRTLPFWLIVIAGALVDLITKRIMFDWHGFPKATRAPYWVIEGLFGFETSINHGALFGMFQGMGWVFVLISLVAMAGILYWLYFRRAYEDWVMTIALGMITGGVIGNLYDRLGLWNRPTDPDNTFGGVRDWILFCWGTDYNLAQF